MHAASKSFPSQNLFLGVATNHPLPDINLFYLHTRCHTRTDTDTHVRTNVLRQDLFQVSRSTRTSLNSQTLPLFPNQAALRCFRRCQVRGVARPMQKARRCARARTHSHRGGQADSEELNQHSCSSSALIVLLSSLKRLHSIFNQAPFARLCSTFSRFAPPLLHHARCTFRALLSSRALLHSDYLSAPFSFYVYTYLISLNVKSALLHSRQRCSLLCPSPVLPAVGRARVTPGETCFIRPGDALQPARPAPAPSARDRKSNCPGLLWEGNRSIHFPLFRLSRRLFM